MSFHVLSLTFLSSPTYLRHPCTVRFTRGPSHSYMLRSAPSRLCTSNSKLQSQTQLQCVLLCPNPSHLTHVAHMCYQGYGDCSLNYRLNHSLRQCPYTAEMPDSYVSQRGT